MPKKGGGGGGKASKPNIPKNTSITNHISQPKVSKVKLEEKKLKQVEQNALLVQKTTIKETQNETNKMLDLDGSGLFRFKIIFALLSGRSIRINDIRLDDPVKPGLREYEVNFLRFIDSLTTGTILRINPTGTSIKFTPGVLLGGKVTHECTTARSIGYLLEVCIFLGPFCKDQLEATFTSCITNSDTDVSCDIIRAVTLRQLQHFGFGDLDLLGERTPGPTIKVNKRGAPPLGGGEVVFTFPNLTSQQSLKACTLLDPGMIKRIRGLAYSTKCSSSFAQRMVNSSRGVMNGYIGDIHIYTDSFTTRNGGNSPGYAIGLAAESTTGCVLASQRTAITTSVLAAMTEGEGNKGKSADATTTLVDSLPGDIDLITPEDVGRVAAKGLLEEISFGGCVDAYHQLLFIVYMALGPDQQVSRVRFGPLSPQCVYLLRLLKEFWGVQFQLTPDVKSQTIMVSCVGIGYQNMNKRVC